MAKKDAKTEPTAETTEKKAPQRKPIDLVAFVNHREGEKDGRAYSLDSMTAYRIVSPEPMANGRYQDNARLNYEKKPDGTGYRDRSIVIPASTKEKIMETGVVFENPEDPNTSIAFIRGVVNFQPEGTQTGKDGKEYHVQARQYVNPKTLEKVEAAPEGVTDYESARKFIYDNKGLSFENGQKNHDLDTPQAAPEEAAEAVSEIVELEAPEVAEAEVDNEMSGPAY